MILMYLEILVTIALEDAKTLVPDLVKEVVLAAAEAAALAPDALMDVQADAQHLVLQAVVRNAPIHVVVHVRGHAKGRVHMFVVAYAKIGAVIIVQLIAKAHVRMGAEWAVTLIA